MTLAMQFRTITKDDTITIGAGMITTDIERMIGVSDDIDTIVVIVAVIPEVTDIDHRAIMTVGAGITTMIDETGTEIGTGRTIDVTADHARHVRILM